MRDKMKCDLGKLLSVVFLDEQEIARSNVLRCRSEHSHKAMQLLKLRKTDDAYEAGFECALCARYFAMPVNKNHPRQFHRCKKTKCELDYCSACFDQYVC